MSTDTRPQSESGSAATDADGVRRTERLTERYERIRRSRRRRAIGGLTLLGVIGFLFLQALSAVGMFDAEYNAPFFLESLRDFFPITWYFGVIPFLDIGQYWAFITERQLLFDPAVGQLLVTDPVAFFIDELGIFAVFGEAGTTLAIGLGGTIIGFPLALLFGVLGSERVTPFPLNFVFRGTMSAIRSIPALIWALILIPLAGLGPASATLAVGIDTIGNLGRLFTDELEEISEGPIEAMETTGANRPQTITFGMLSQVTTPFIAWTLYIFEINVRAAVALGVIGGGGLGQILEVQQGLLQFTNTMATLLCIFLLIISVELCSQRIRARLRADEEPMGLWELITGFPQRLVESLSK
ncbi:phosphonate ABC transporter, permease protein PhnE [Halopiger aswanensis]|uniref:Phosphonate transport system permease protein n=1 Tax=Halopiger aswanensis TaxID=148449 RepID=A0A3R7FUY9_9EURY|nr:phosphonate ABC transporter, permease protein PhnE [Halopiger aswanensis]RKD94010.1 phosphonate transport system permease protein [Halopiger aswanensis]